MQYLCFVPLCGTQFLPPHQDLQSPTQPKTKVQISGGFLDDILPHTPFVSLSLSLSELYTVQSPCLSQHFLSSTDQARVQTSALLDTASPRVPAGRAVACAAGSSAAVEGKGWAAA